MEQELALDTTNNEGIIGFSASFEHAFGESPQEEETIERQISEFRNYLWGPEGLVFKLQSLKPDAYGKDLRLILLQCYVFPSNISLEHIKEVEGYNAREKAVTLSIVITHAFFNQSEQQRQAFLAATIVDRLTLLPAVIKAKRLDTKIEELIQDVAAVLGQKSVERRNMTPKEIDSLDERAEQQAVTITLRFPSGEPLGTEEERKKAHKFEDDLGGVISSYGEVDGHDIGGGEYTIYLFGSNVDELLKATRKVVESSHPNAIVAKTD